MKINLFLVLLILGATQLLWSQEVSFKAQIEKTEVSVNERFSVQFILTYGQENISADHPIKLPDFGGLIQLGESTINRFQFTNGVAVNQVGKEAILVADHEGSYTIGSAVISLGGKKYKTEPIKITVKRGLKPKEPAGQRMDEAFISAELSNENPFINQEVILVIKMYSRDYGLFQRLRNFKEPDFSDVIAKFVNERPDDIEKQVLINGRTYISRELARYILFPQKTGEIGIDPFSINVFISSFFGSENIPLSTNPISMKVKDLPESGRPANFSGAVGDFKINTILSKSEAKSNETINLDLEIIGTGNLNMLKLPNLSVPENIETYPPKRRDAFDLRPNGMKGKVVESLLLVPQYGGNYQIGPIAFNYFDPTQEKYVTLKSESYQLKVNGPEPPKTKEVQDSTNLASKDKNTDSTSTNFMSDIPQKLNEVKERVTQTVEQKDGWFWGVGGLTLLLIGFLVFRKKQGNRNSEKSKNQLLTEFKNQINKKLDELKLLANHQKRDEFLSLQEQILTKIGIHYSKTALSDFTEEEVARKLKVDYNELSDQWKSILLDCKHSKYGLASAGIDLKSRFEATENLWRKFIKTD